MSLKNLLRDINWLYPTIRLPTQELSSLSLILQSDLDFNSPRYLTTEAEKELAKVEQKLQDIYIDQLDLTH